jgi:hypothetical protein
LDLSIVVRLLDSHLDTASWSPETRLISPVARQQPDTTQPVDHDEFSRQQ